MRPVFEPSSGLPGLGTTAPAPARCLFPLSPGQPGEARLLCGRRVSCSTPFGSVPTVSLVSDPPLPRHATGLKMWCPFIPLSLHWEGTAPAGSCQRQAGGISSLFYYLEPLESPICSECPVLIPMRHHPPTSHHIPEKPYLLFLVSCHRAAWKVTPSVLPP